MIVCCHARNYCLIFFFPYFRFIFCFQGAIMSGQRGQHSNGSKTPIDLDQIWSDLLQGIEKVYNKQAMSKKQYMDLYT